MHDASRRTPPPLVWPALLFTLALLLGPLALVAMTSVSTRAAGNVGGVTPEHFLRFLGDPYYRGVLWTTLRVSAFTTVACVLLAYPFAWWTVRQRGWWRSVLMFAALAPLMVTVSIRTLGWVVLLADNGPVNALLAFTGIVTGPVRTIYTEFAVVIGLVEALLPFMILALFTALQAIPVDVLHAATIAGATPWQRFLRIVLPLSRTGLAAGSVLVFALASSAFVTPRILGGGRTTTVANLVVDQFLVSLNWPFGAAIGILLFSVIGLVMAAERLLRGRR
jgi:ABC-type spermidine/putrescine transport system permease subunit I